MQTRSIRGALDRAGAQAMATEHATSPDHDLDFEIDL